MLPSCIGGYLERKPSIIRTVSPLFMRKICNKTNKHSA